jgi:hypothetical protein
LEAGYVIAKPEGGLKFGASYPLGHIVRIGAFRNFQAGVLKNYYSALIMFYEPLTIWKFGV